MHVGIRVQRINGFGQISDGAGTMSLRQKVCSFSSLLGQRFRPVFEIAVPLLDQSSACLRLPRGALWRVTAICSAAETSRNVGQLGAEERLLRLLQFPRPAAQLRLPMNPLLGFAARRRVRMTSELTSSSVGRALLA